MKASDRKQKGNQANQGTKKTNINGFRDASNAEMDTT